MVTNDSVCSFRGDHKQKFYWGHKEILIPGEHSVKELRPQNRTDWTVVVVVAFSSRASVLGGCSTVHSLPALFFSSVEISLRKLIPLFRLGSVYSGSVT